MNMPSFGRRATAFPRHLRKWKPTLRSGINIPRLWPEFDENGKMHTLTFEESQKKEALAEQAEAACKAVPEWQ